MGIYELAIDCMSVGDGDMKCRYMDIREIFSANVFVLRSDGYMRN